MTVALLIALSIVSAYAVAVTLLHAHQSKAIDVLMQRWIRANGQFMALDAEHNKLCAKYSQALMQLEDARK